MIQDLELKHQVREILRIIQQVAPGKSVEIRIPLYAAIQCIAGKTHRRGTPPNVVEMSAEVLFDISKGKINWASAISDGRISASGERSDLSALFQQLATAE